MFGVNPRVIGSVNYRHELLPEPFVANRSSDILQSNARRCVKLLSAQTTRNCWVVLDETYYHPCQDIIVNLRETKLAIIGGWFAEAEDTVSNCNL